MGGEQPYSTRQILQHGQGELGMLLKDDIQSVAVNRDHRAVAQGDCGGNPGTAVKEGSLAQNIARMMDRKRALIPVGGADIAFDRTADQIIKMCGVASLKIDELTGPVRAGGLSLSQR